MTLPFGNFSGQVFTDASNLVPPDQGGANGGPLAVAFGSVTYANTTAKTLFRLPKGAVIVGWIVNVTEAFNSSGTDLLDIGDGSTGNRFKNDLDVSSTGQTLTGWVAGQLFTPLTEEIAVTATFAQSVADADEGAATVACIYMLA